MEQQQTTRPVPDHLRPGRLLATIVRTTTREKGYIFARLIDSGEECFVHISGVPPELWEDLTTGDAVTCKVSDTSKGLRGFDIQAGTDEEKDRVKAEEEFRGNRGQRHSER